MHARHGAVRRAGFFADILTAQVFSTILFQRNRRIAALLRAIVNQAVFANVQITGTGAAAPLVGTSLRNVVLKSVDAGEAALLERLHLVIDTLLFFPERLQLAGAVVNDSYR
jgi:hypothetical protein